MCVCAFLLPCTSTNTVVAATLSAHPKQRPTIHRYYEKCVALKFRIAEITMANAAAEERVDQNDRALDRARLERAFLLEQVAKLMPQQTKEDSPDSPQPQVVSVSQG